MLKKTLLAACITAISFSSSANWVGGVSYVNLSEDEAGMDISLGAIVGSIAYKTESENNFYFIPELRLGVGLGDDSVEVFGTSVDVEMDRFVSLSVKGQYEFDNSVYVFLAPSYTNVEVTASTAGISATEDDWEFGLGGGLGYQFNEAAALEVSLEQFDGSDLLSLGIKFAF